MLSKVPTALLVFLASFLMVPFAYTLDKLDAMHDPIWVFASAVITLPLCGLVSVAIVRDSPAKGEILFYVWSVFSFTSVAGLLVALELDGYVQGFMEFYLREGEPYLRSAHGTMVDWWDGIANFAMYIIMIALLCSGKNYRVVGLYWVGSFINSVIVYLPGSAISNQELKLSFLINIPYVVFPIYAGVKFLREGMRIKHKEPGSKKLWERLVDWTFCVWFVAATGVAMFRMVSCMGCKDWISNIYVTDIEPYLTDPNQYGRTQALCYFYYFIPFYVAAICSHIYPGQFWIKDWSVVHAGVSSQGQIVYIASSLHWRTDPEHIVPDTLLARSVFWTINLSLLIIPHLHALYCNRAELADFMSREITPMLFRKKTKGSPPYVKRNKIPVRQDGPVTRQQKKNK